MGVEMQEFSEEQGQEGEGEEVTAGEIRNRIDTATGMLVDGIHGASYIGLAGTDDLHTGQRHATSCLMIWQDERRKNGNEFLNIRNPGSHPRASSPHLPSLPSLTTVEVERVRAP